MSFYHYSCEFAINLWIDGKTTCFVKSNNYEFPTFTESVKDKKYEKLFKSDAKTRYAREGAPVVVENGSAKFKHQTIEDFFVARVFYENLKKININNKNSVIGSYLNSKVIDIEKD